MNQLAAQVFSTRPTFSTAVADILGGKLPLWCELTDRQKDKGKTDCAIVAVDFDAPGCLAIALLRYGCVTIVGSFQAKACMMWGEDDQESVPVNEVPLDDFLRRVGTGLHTGNLGNVVFLEEPPMVRAFLVAFSASDLPS